MAEKRLFWLKLKDDFFSQKEIKKVRRLEGGDTFLIIYLKMLLRSLESDGHLAFDGYEDSFTEELAMDLDEDEERVEKLVAFLLKSGLLIQLSDTDYQLPAMHEMTISEGGSTNRSRNSRANKALAEKGDTLQCNNDATLVQRDATKCNTDIDIEKDTDIETDTDTEKETHREEEIKKDIKENMGGHPGAQRPGLSPPSLNEIQEHALECNYSRSEFIPESFYAFYSGTGWRVRGQPIYDWKAMARAWVLRYRRDHPRETEQGYVDPIDQMTPEQKQAEADRLRREHRAERERMRREKTGDAI